MESIKLFQQSAFPALDDHLWDRVSKYANTDTVVLARVRITHNYIVSTIHVLYVFRMNEDARVFGIWLKKDEREAESLVDFALTIAKFYSHHGIEMKMVDCEYGSG